MDLDIRIRHSAADLRELRDHLAALLARSVRRAGRPLSWVVVHIRDLNGPKGGADKQAVVRVKSANGTLAVAEERDPNAVAAADRGLRRALKSLKTHMLRGRRR